MISTKKRALDAIRKAGVLLVFPINNRPEPDSIWSHLHPKIDMRWEWDDDGDQRVSDLWHLREELSRSNQVVYTKWYQGRATFFSRPVFVALLKLLNENLNSSLTTPLASGLSPTALSLLRELESDSPLSTKVLKSLSDLKGRANEALYTRSLKELWQRHLIVGYGEVDEGAFPSLAIGSTQVLFEDLWNEARESSRSEAEKILRSTLSSDSPFLRHFEKLIKNRVKPDDIFSDPSPVQNLAGRSAVRARHSS